MEYHLLRDKLKLSVISKSFQGKVMKTFKLLLISTLVLAFIGCGDTADTVDETTKAVTFDMDKVSYQVPDGMNLVAGNIQGTVAKMISGGSNEELVGFVQEINTTTPTAKSYKSIQKGVETAFSQLSATGGSIDSISLLSSQNFQTPYAFTIAHYKLMTSAEIEPLTLAGEILNTIAGGQVTGLPVAAATATVDTEFRLVLLYGEYEDSSFYIAVVVPESLYTQYETQSSGIVNAARVLPKGKILTSLSENFTQNVGQQKADFLFVVDDSGSMSDNQDALSQAADDFSAEMTGSGLAYRSAVITTGDGADDQTNGDAYRILRDAGIIENNTTLLKQALVAGTNGSSTETGIWNAEQSLQSLALNDAFDGAVTLAGMPQSGATLSVIILSDEDSQYSNRSGGVDFNVSNNLFLDRNIRVYSIVKPSYSYETTGIFDEYNSSEYDDLSLVTNGLYADIENKDSNGSLDFSIIMKQIAQDAGGAASAFILAHSATVINEVKVNGTVVVEDAMNGYTYVQASKAIVFHGTSLPASGATIVVSYDYYQ